MFYFVQKNSVFFIVLSFFTGLLLWVGVYRPLKTCEDTKSVGGGVQAITDEKKAASPPGRTIYAITTTYPRSEQVAELTRLGQTLKLVPDLVWLVIEDVPIRTPAVERLLTRLQVPHVHLTVEMPSNYLLVPMRDRPRGVFNRNRGLEWLRANATSGVFYFADENNAYDIRLFEEMRNTQRISMWPMGLLSSGVASPIIYQDRVVGFWGWNTETRIFAVDMAEFAISVEFLLQRPDAEVPLTAGFPEDEFLQSFYPFSFTDIEFKASNCTEVFVWRTQTKPPPRQRPLNTTLFMGTNLIQLLANL